MSPTRKLLFTLAAIAIATFLLYRVQLPDDGVGTSAVDQAAETGEGNQAPETRVADTVTPLAYRLRFTIDPRQDRFQGRAEINIAIRAPTRRITLYGKKLNVRRARVYTSGGEAVAARWREISDSGVAELIAGHPLEEGQVTIVIDYEAAFKDDLEGLYKISAGDQSFAFTQFEATSARFAFPSFDEPRFKTPYHLSFRVPGEMTVIGNTPVLMERVLNDGGKVVVLSPTPPLPSYLVAFAVGAFEITDGEAIAANDLRAAAVPLRAVTVPGKGDGVALALAETGELLRALESYVGLPYPYEKLDLIAVPDFAASAMENPGAIMYRDSEFLTTATPSFQHLYNFYDTHVHELVHQWFGDLVTPLWWDDLWLNESFADWLAAKVLTERHPTLGFDREVQRGAMIALALDSEPNVRRVRQPILTQEDIDSAFSPITYEKGAAVLSMFEAYMGDDRFHKAVTSYLRRHAGGNASTDDFLKAISETTGEEATASAMRGFIDQPGVPLVAIEWSCPQQGVNITATQTRYRPIGVAEAPPSRWAIPLCTRFIGQGGKEQTQCVLAKQETQTFYLRDTPCPLAVVPNANGNGYYRWRLSADKWRAVGDIAAQLTPAEALSLADSLSASFRDGSLALGDYLPLIRQLAITSDWDAIVPPIADLRFLLHHVVPHDAVSQAAARAIISDIYRPRLEFGLEDMSVREGESASGRRELLRRLLDLYVRDLEDPAITAMLAEHGRRSVGYKSKPEPPDASYARLALTAALMVEGAPFAGYLIGKISGKQNAAFREDAIFAMADTPRGDVVVRLLDFLISSDARTDELYRGLEHLYQLPNARDLVWPWLLDHVDAVAARLPDWMKGELAMSVAGFCDVGDHAVAEQALRPRMEALGATQRLGKALADIDRCVALKEVVRAETLEAFGIVPPPSPEAAEITDAAAPVEPAAGIK